MANINRRQVLRLAGAASVSVAVGAAVANPSAWAKETTAGPQASSPVGTEFEHKGVRVVLTPPKPGEPDGKPPENGGGPSDDPDAVAYDYVYPGVVTLNGQNLHVMYAEGGGFVTWLTHYDPKPTLEEAVRNAIDLLNGRTFDGNGHSHH